MESHDEHCKEIVESLEAYSSGDYFMYNGDIYPFYEADKEYWDKNNAYVSGEYYLIDGEKVEESEAEENRASLWDYFDEVYDVKYTVDSRKEYCSVCIMVACGGPNIYIDTGTKQVELYWWGERGNAYMPQELVEAVDEYWEEMWDCL